MNYWVIAFVFVGIAFAASFISFISIQSMSSSILNDWQKTNLLLDVFISLAAFLLAYKNYSESNKHQAKITNSQLLVFA
jgi:hypothetical protein